jgi:hypothetical protein
MSQSEHFELGYFGNIWVRQHILHKKDDASDGHKHNFDHITMLIKGSVQVEVEGHEPKQFKAPTFIVIRKEHRHRMMALEDDCWYYCVFALRNLDGEVIEDMYSEKHDPLSASGVNHVRVNDDAGTI